MASLPALNKASAKAHEQISISVRKPIRVGFNGEESITLPKPESKGSVCYMTYGRFQPCHKGHLALFNYMCQLANQDESGGSGKSGKSERRNRCGRCTFSLLLLLPPTIL